MVEYVLSDLFTSSIDFPPASFDVILENPVVVVFAKLFVAENVLVEFNRE